RCAKSAGNTFICSVIAADTRVVAFECPGLKAASRGEASLREHLGDATRDQVRQNLGHWSTITNRGRMTRVHPASLSRNACDSPVEPAVQGDTRLKQASDNTKARGL